MKDARNLLDSQSAEIRIIEDFLDVREHALAQEFTDYEGLDGVTYKGSCVVEVPGLRSALEKAIGPVDMLGMGYRLALEGELPNQAIHSDVGWGTHALVLYIGEGRAKTGTCFWKHKSTGHRTTDTIKKQTHLNRIIKDTDDFTKWDCEKFVMFRHNRAVIFPSSRFHSRWPFEGFGTDKYTGRLIAVAFFTPKEKYE